MFQTRRKLLYYHLTISPYVGVLITVSELKNVPKNFVHKPWELNDEKILKFGKDYPLPIVVHEEARSKALLAFKKI